MHIITDDKLLQQKKQQTTTADPDRTQIVSVFALLGHMIAHLFFPVLMSLNEAC